MFTREESKELLRRSGPDDLDDAEADRLADALGDLPLALEQAAAWRAETGMPVSEYLRLFEHKRSELLEVSPPPDYQLPVAAAWNVSLDHLETRSLTACACSSSAPTSRRTPSHAPSSPARGSTIDPELDRALNDPMRLARAIREINRYSLARIDHRTNSIEMHRLVQAVLINRMTAEEQKRMRNGAHTLLAAADRRRPTRPPTGRATPSSTAMSSPPARSSPTSRGSASSCGTSPGTSGTGGTTRSPASSPSRPGRPGSDCSARRTSRPS
ncbi:hypothetical protein [Streptomyces sp. F001]|uniref:DUF7779 domain-containing protein n=1 Tax=Streptomyces sp. F001 TaxID=1510026 RepID=UPI00101E4802|nr:hypothetical protein [Streptomyces sp. F001]